jgi:aldehyde dehydrogenase (NAD+)
MHRVAKSLNVGMVWVNTYRAVAVQVPFGGVKKVGLVGSAARPACWNFSPPKT